MKILKAIGLLLLVLIMGDLLVGLATLEFWRGNWSVDLRGSVTIVEAVFWVLLLIASNAPLKEN